MSPVEAVRDTIGAPITFHTNAAHQTGRPRWSSRVATIAALCEQGYADRIALSHDAACYMDFFSRESTQQALAEAAPNWHYLHISNDVLPALRERGVTDEQIHTMLVDNPRRYLAGQE